MRSALFWRSTHSVLLNPYRTFGTTTRPHFQAKNSWPLKTGRISFPEASVNNYHYTLRNNTKERSSYLLRSGSLKSRKFNKIVTFPVTGYESTDRLMPSVSGFFNFCSFLRKLLLIIRYSGTVKTCRINAIYYLPRPLTLLLSRYTQHLPSKFRYL